MDLLWPPSCGAVADDKAPKSRGPLSQPDGSVSGEFVRRTDAEQDAFRPKSTRRRALQPPVTPEEDLGELELEGGRPSSKREEEQTLRSARVPQRIRMSLRMRRVAAGSSQAGTELRAQDQIAVRLGGQVFDVPTGGQRIAGRSADCDIFLGDRLCSRQHALFSRAEDGSVRVRDLGTTNGTYVNGVRIVSEHRLAPGDWITLGNETLELCVASVAQQPERPTIPARPQTDSKTRRGHATAKTDPGSEILSLASLAATSAGKVSTTPPADVARKPLDALLGRVDHGQQIAESEARMGALVALHLARGSGDAAWLDYAFRLYSALPAPLPAELIERLREVLADLRPRKLPSFRRYLELLELQRAGLDAAQRELLKQLHELHAQLTIGLR